jgi:DNA uptake protein ComE-like DNA-binding protein
VRQRVIGVALIVACAVVAAAGGNAPVAARAPSGATKHGAAAASAQPIDINSASRAQLKTLPGIGDAEADRIIAARPYLSKAHLVTEAGLPTGVYLSIRRQVVAVQNKEARAKLRTLAAAQRRVER